MYQDLVRRGRVPGYGEAVKIKRTPPRNIFRDGEFVEWGHGGRTNRVNGYTLYEIYRDCGGVHMRT